MWKQRFSSTLASQDVVVILLCTFPKLDMTGYDIILLGNKQEV